MKTNNISFPYPVLGIGDDVLPLPSITYEISKDQFNYIVNIDIVMENKTIQNLVNDGFANYTCEVDCSSTFYRICHHEHSPHFSIEIPRSQVARTIIFQCAITVTKNIENYTNEGFDPVYSDYSFQLTPGDLLAFIGEFSCEADIEYDKLKNIDSMMVISESSENVVSYQLGKNKIEIMLPKELYDAYKNGLKGRRFSSILHASIVEEALTYALYNINEYADKTWARIVKLRLETEEELKNLGVNPFEDLEDIPKLAQAMLGKPYNRMFSALKIINDMLTNVEEEE